MIGICLGVSLCLIQAQLPGDRFTLAWTHSIEKIRWEEDYRIEHAHLVLVEARVQGAGAGMEPSADAEFRHGWWHYRPALEPLSVLTLARSRSAGDHELCWDGRCRPLASVVGEPPADYAPLLIFPCPLP